jgi:hypothetical protein
VFDAKEEMFMHPAIRLSLLMLPAAVLSACYVVPERAPDGSVIYQHYPLPPLGSPAPAVTPRTAAPVNLPVRLYPSNEEAAKIGVVSGSVTNLMTGKGVFNVSFMGEVLTGEATRVSNEERRGVASAYSPRGMYMSCEYQMNTPYQGAGNCTFSNGASYRMHIGSSQ